MKNDISRKNWVLIWVMGLAGQICWNIENSWFNTFVYDKISKDPSIISWMVGVSAITATLATFVMGTWSDRSGKRKPFIATGYILWGVFTIAFGATEFLPSNPLISAAVLIVTADAIMSFFGSTGNDAGFNAWTTDISNERNRGKLGGALATMPVIATIFGAIVSGFIIDTLDFFPFFVLMGCFVILMGIIALFTLKDDPGLRAQRDHKGYFRQFASVFNWKTVTGNQELFWVFVLFAVYFIGFNVYFPYITIYFKHYLNMDYSTAGVLQGIGLIAAVLLTIPAAKAIDKGSTVKVIQLAVLANFSGLLILSFSTHTALLLTGIFGAGIGFVLVSQSLTAWVKNLYPEEQRGQFEGIKQIFLVCIPMVAGPMVSAYVINHYGVMMETDGVTGYIPSETLFLVSALLTLFTFLPLIPAGRMLRRRRQLNPAVSSSPQEDFKC